jgi:hypothetical protein
MLSHDAGESRDRGGLGEMGLAELLQGLEEYGKQRRAEGTGETEKEGNLGLGEEWSGASSLRTMLLCIYGQVLLQPGVDPVLRCTTCGDRGKFPGRGVFRTLAALEALDVSEDIHSGSLPVQTIV